MYGNVTLADAYWAARLNGALWSMQGTSTKNQALQSASDKIDALGAAGRLIGTPDPTNATGVFYPLDDAEGVIPPNILNATYELALCLILNPQIPGLTMSNVKRSKQGQTETEFFGRQSPWEAAGVPCQSVWQLLVPFMGDPRELTLNRVS